MKLHDLLDLSVGNLWRIKLRTFLTVAGVVIAIATFVAMMSFAAGNQKFVSDAYQDLGLLMNINVWPKSNNAASDTTTTAILNRESKTGIGLGDLYLQPINLGWHTARADFSVGMGIIAGVYPALRASRLDPIDALRYE